MSTTKLVTLEQACYDIGSASNSKGQKSNVTGHQISRFYMKRWLNIHRSGLISNNTKIINSTAIYMCFFNVTVQAFVCHLFIRKGTCNIKTHFPLPLTCLPKCSYTHILQHSSSLHLTNQSLFLMYICTLNDLGKMNCHDLHWKMLCLLYSTPSH